MDAERGVVVVAGGGNRKAAVVVAVAVGMDVVVDVGRMEIRRLSASDKDTALVVVVVVVDVEEGGSIVAGGMVAAVVVADNRGKRLVGGVGDVEEGMTVDEGEEDV
jgi:hypothetical protein